MPPRQGNARPGPFGVCAYGPRNVTLAANPRVKARAALSNSHHNSYAE